MLALPPCDYSLDHSVVYHGLVIITRRLENAGRSFFQEYEKKPKDNVQIDENRGSVKKKLQTPTFSSKSKKDLQNTTPVSTNHLKRVLEGPNLYSVLGLEETCTSEEIRKRYHELALYCHPDKSHFTPTTRSASEPLKNLSLDDAFLLLQDAYEILIQPSARLQYDSSLPFDDSVPLPGSIKAEDIAADYMFFFNTFEPVFRRNARWSRISPVQTLGSMETPYDQVISFYTFWWHFESIRTFCVQDEYDLTEADCREHRRWMEKQNQKTRKKHLQKEHDRILELTNLAYQLDPRLLKLKEDKKDLKKQKKIGAINAKNLEASPQLSTTSTVKPLDSNESKVNVSTLAEAKELAASKQQLKTFLKQCRSRLRQILQAQVESTDLVILDEEIQLYVRSVAKEDLETKLQSLEMINDLRQRISQFKLELKCTSNVDNEKTNVSVTLQNEKKASHQTPSQPQATVWNQSEIALFEKAIVKYPQGTLQRWEKIAACVGTKSLVEVLERQSSMKNRGRHGILSDPQQNSVSAKVWTKEEQKILEDALKKYKNLSPQDEEKWRLVSEIVPGRSSKECKLRYFQIRDAILKRKSVN